MSDPILPPAEVVPDVAGPARPKRLVCEFCECPLAPSGEFMKLSDKAKHYRELDDKLERANALLAESQAETATARRERDEARALIPPKKNPLW